MLVRSSSTTVLKRVTAVCMEEMPALPTRSSHVPGRSARVKIATQLSRTSASMESETETIVEDNEKESVSYCVRARLEACT